MSTGRFHGVIAEPHEFARLLTEEQGKPLPQALEEIGRSGATIRYFATCDLPPEVLNEDAMKKVVRQHRPLGVVAAIRDETQSSVFTEKAR